MSYLLQLFVGGFMSYLLPVVCRMVMPCRRAHVLFVFFIYCGWWCPVGGLMSYLCFVFIVYGGVL